MMTTVGKELLSTANEMTSADDINDLYNLQYIGRVAMDIAQKVSSGDWLCLTFPGIPDAEYCKVALYNLSTETSRSV